MLGGGHCQGLEGVSELALCFSSVSRGKISWVGRFLEEKNCCGRAQGWMTSPGDPQGGEHRRGTVLATQVIWGIAG